jgi:hypothetical protein
VLNFIHPFPDGNGRMGVSRQSVAGIIASLKRRKIPRRVGPDKGGR